MGSQASELLRSRKILLAFDFDHTIVDGNTDTWVTKAAPGGDVPLELRNSYERGHWTEYMQRVLAHLHASGVTIADMQTALQQLQYTAGMEHLWQHLEGSDNCCSIILSDSNSQFIDWILSSRGHSKVFRWVTARALLCNALTGSMVKPLSIRERTGRCVPDRSQL